MTAPGEVLSRWQRVLRELRRWGLARGSVRLMALRATSLLMVAAPFTLLVRRGLSGRSGRVPELVQAPSTTVAIVQNVVGDLSASSAAALLASLLLWWLLDPWLAGTALAVAGSNGAPRVWRRLWDEAWPRLPALWRVMMFSLPAGAAGVAGLGWLFGLLHDRAAREGADAWHSVVALPGAQALATLGLWLAVGVFALWCRVLIMADGRKRVRRVVGLVPRVWWRAPLRAFALPWLLTMLVQLAGAAVLVAVAPDRSLLASLLLWAGYLVLQLLLWQGALRAMRSLYAEPRFESVRARPDAPWGWMAKLWRLLARQRVRS